MTAVLTRTSRHDAKPGPRAQRVVDIVLIPPHTRGQ
ncbi:hypothetical protein ATK86_4918 [Nocardia fluminea]|uniref:Uncharacterized protein n=1 Tax=Nocardia fluminea TaxID=134984 RepID=A0A2N3VFT1_9NOCA|nr:hypothetical protein ATK86_4918 [Nocardia fluminea]